MANNKDFIVKNAVEVGGSTKVTVGDAAAAGSYTAGYDLSVAAYDSVSFSVAAQETGPQGIRFNSDGTKVFIIGNVGDDVNEYSLSTAWDISSASYTRNFSVASQDTAPLGFCFNSDGTKMYMVGNTNDNVYQYTLTTGFDLSTASYDSKSFSFSSQDTSPADIFISPNGTKVFIFGGSNDAIYQYTLSTAYDISTASYDSVSLSVASEETQINGATFNSDGTKIFITGQITDAVYQYNLTTAYDLSTGSYSSNSFSVSTQETGPTGIEFSDDGTKMYIVGSVSDTIYQYSTGSTVTTGSFDLSTGNYFTDTPSADVEYTFSNAGDVQTVQVEVTGNQSVVGYDLANASYDNVSFSVASQPASPLFVGFSSDGTKMYTTNDNTDDIHQYTLATAWDVSTASYDSKSFSISSQDGNAISVRFKSDGTKMFVLDYDIGGNIYQYSLSTAWDVSTASYDSVSFSLSSQATSYVLGLYLKPDGTKMYITELGTNSIYEYSLSTAWDLSTASYNSSSFSVNSQATNPASLEFNEDGTSVFVLNVTNDTIYQYNLSTAWDISSASYASINFSYGSQVSASYTATFGNSGTKMYVIHYNSPYSVYQYTTGSSTAITITWDADIEWGGGTAPDSPANGEKDLYTITTDDGGTTYFGVQSGDAFS